MPNCLPACLCLLLTLAGCVSVPAPQEPVSMPSLKALVIGHRGASALRPEHTLAAYAKAIDDGADLIEPDLVNTRDGVLVARHENEISGTTDVARHPEFASRKTTKTIDGERATGWFTEDFTLKELKTLRARERLPELRSTAFDGRFEIATLDEIIALAAEASAKHGRMIGLAPEIKHPSHFATLGLAMEDALLATLRAHPHARTAPVIIQSFEVANLRELRGKIGSQPNISLLQLFGRAGDRPYDTVIAGAPLRYGAMMQADGLREVATYADAIGPAYRDLDAVHGRSRLLDEAHAAGLQVIVYTFRPENYFLDGAHRGDGGPAARHETGSIAEIRAHLALGIDGFFTDDPALGRRAVDGL
ncbi:MAG: glycerophosphodiester phosphodiesterase [Xanthomonadales bacterium]|nr:glycerophosphodiester phosphodiesterase [Xanthomonadales bacterium]